MITITPDVVTSLTRQYNEFLDLTEWNGIRMSGDPEGRDYFMERRNLTATLSDSELNALRRKDGNNPSNVSYFYGVEWTVYRGNTTTFDRQLRLI
jgi:hypothetical protein